MPKQIIIAEKNHVAAVFSEDQIQELVVATGNQQVSDIYLGTVENVIPGIDAAFVNIGDAERNGFMHVSDLGPLRLQQSAGAITELLAPQQTVLVQVMKEPTGNKGPRLTGKVSLPGRYLVLMPYGRGVNLSRRIKNENERSRLRALAILIKPAGMGLLVRTEAEGKDEKAIMEDLENLKEQWESIQQQAESTKPPSLLNRDDDFIQRVLRDIYTADVNRIVVDSHSALKRVKQQLMNWSGGRPPEGVLIDHHRERQHILEYFRVNAAIREALKPRVDLPSGGYIIIEPTEALTVIDVNSGSFTQSATSRETVSWTNNQAAREIARQLRLRNLGGVVVIDFIDMDSSGDRLELLNTFNKALKADKARPQIAQLSELGLVELTRKRQGKNIYELFGKECPTCGGLGHLAHLPGEGDEQRLADTPISLATPSTTISLKPIIDKEKEKRHLESEVLFDLKADDDEGSDFDSSSGDALDSASGTRRRRRKRLGDNETVSPKPTKVNNGGSEVRSQTPETPAPTRSNNYDRYNRSPRRESAEPEKISVEMTPLEQDIYALMGISPLIRVEREIRNPKAAIVEIKDSSESPMLDSEPAELSPEPPETIQMTLPETEFVVDDTPEPEEIAEEMASDLEDSESDSDARSTVRRRRRRRSSAQNE
ncbi:MAG: Rne/Rng family ribonuclease [Jaaginema sp. PMC 1079.18]|nr:Rne/Rng family ribonuclease [Jaaginema sp. PMC 1080.18]MEC4850466.1 Rne/Rng family ribonuclease [Jaaginema sp. PMC 1079.18]MEC4866583.1 Rne/Rng family ribonuclease [Jaaginema sp. PMC 1078.18]